MGGSRASRTPFQLRRRRKHLHLCRHRSPPLLPQELCPLHLLFRASRHRRVGQILDDQTLENLLTLLAQRPRRLPLQILLRKMKTSMTPTITLPLRPLLEFLLRHLSLSHLPHRLLVRTTTTRNLLTSHNLNRGLLLARQVVDLRLPLAAH